MGQLGNGATVVTIGRGSGSNQLLPPQAKEWKQAASSVERRRFEAGGAVLSSADPCSHRFLVAGGENFGSTMRSIEIYDATIDRWTLHDSSLPSDMKCSCAPIVGGAVLAVQTDGLTKSQTCAVLDVRANSAVWRSVALPERRTRHVVTSVGEGDQVLQVAGLDPQRRYTESNAIQLYDVRANRWCVRSELCMPATSQQHCAVVMDLCGVLRQ